jgi:hypothetical protein
MSSLMAIPRATSMLALGATSLFGQVDRGAVIARPTIPTTVLRQPTLVQPLAGPANLTVTPAPTEASLRWDSVPGVKGYLVTRFSALYGNIQQTPTPITGTSFTDVTQQFNPRYLFTYSVIAVYPDGRGATSTVTYLPAPASVTRPQWGGNCYGSGAGWTTNWAAVPEATGYVVRYKLRQTNGWNVYRTVDTSIVVPASPTSHYVREYCSPIGGIFGTVGVENPAVSTIFANGARSAATAAP